MSSVEGLVAALQVTPPPPSLGETFEACARQCANPATRQEFASLQVDVKLLEAYITGEWTALERQIAPTLGQNGDDDGLGYSYTTSKSDLADAALPGTAFLDIHVASMHVAHLLSCYRFLRNVCVSTPATQSTLHALLSTTTLMLRTTISWLDTPETELKAQLALMAQVMLQFLGNVVVAHPVNQQTLWPLFHPDLLEKILVECQLYRKMIAYAAAVVVNCLHPHDAARTTSLVEARQVIILLLQRCLTQEMPSDNGDDPALEWITMIFQTLFQRQTAALLYRNLSASLLSSLWAKLTPEQMLLLRMLDMVLMWQEDDSTGKTGVSFQPMDDAALVPFFCDEFRALHATDNADETEPMLEAPSVDRQAMWKVMEVETSKLMLHILGTLTSLHMHMPQPAILAFIPVLVTQLQRFAPTHGHSTNAFTQAPKEDETYGYRSAGIRVLGNVVHQNTEAQDAMRTCGGLEVLLNSCNVDPTNPMIREWALVALRHVCEGNEANQAYIRALSPQQVVSDVDLTKMGVEPVLEDNKIAWKPKPAE
ncbi:Aste57867_426 [Aphanomyces stellatus]|uniref:Aste57867_426 protein n=1 Tax=Aphanomyces stellatus TaxID=120398 RepID=A0A485K592_9STRA|nr:hypothetical protein As57867_000425 [Aphanomyces stellatus]VFT77651.1 Aste57867_426 [Aphanomyces stellatus]